MRDCLGSHEQSEVWSPGIGRHYLALHGPYPSSGLHFRATSGQQFATLGFTSFTAFNATLRRHMPAHDGPRRRHGVVKLEQRNHSVGKIRLRSQRQYLLYKLPRTLMCKSNSTMLPYRYRVDMLLTTTVERRGALTGLLTKWPRTAFYSNGRVMNLTQILDSQVRCPECAHVGYCST